MGVCCNFFLAYSFLFPNFPNLPSVGSGGGGGGGQSGGGLGLGD